MFYVYNLSFFIYLCAENIKIGLMLNFLKNWTLPVAMLTGVLGYLMFANFTFLICQCDDLHLSFPPGNMLILTPILLPHRSLSFLLFLFVFDSIKDKHWEIWDLTASNLINYIIFVNT